MYDEELLIKYPIYNVDEIFKNKKIASDNNESIHKDIDIIQYKESFFIKILNR